MAVDEQRQRYYIGVYRSRSSIMPEDVCRVFDMQNHPIGPTFPFPSNDARQVRESWEKCLAIIAKAGGVLWSRTSQSGKE